MRPCGDRGRFQVTGSGLEGCHLVSTRVLPRLMSVAEAGAGQLQQQLLDGSADAALALLNPCVAAAQQCLSRQRREAETSTAEGASDAVGGASPVKSGGSPFPGLEERLLALPSRLVPLLLEPACPAPPTLLPQCLLVRRCSHAAHLC